MKKKSLLLIVVILAIFSGKIMAQSNSLKDKTVHISFSNSVEGYRVNAIWKPEKLRYNHVIGPAIIEFNNEEYGTSFSIANGHFSILKDLLPFTYEDYEIKAINRKDIVLSYPQNLQFNKDDFGTTQVPFFFMDVDFDGKKELLISEVDNGQRGVATFKVYKLDMGEPNDLYGIAESVPLTLLDEMSEMDRNKKNITIHYSSGACGSWEEVYQLKESISIYEEKGFVLVLIIEDQWDEKDENCYRYVYSVSENKKTLISKTAREFN